MKPETTRQACNEHDLVQLLNWELAAYERCNGARFTSIKSVASPDPAGCNWCDARLKSDHSLDRRERRIVRRVIAQTRREFNLS
jgi:hypothetical protein